MELSQQHIINIKIKITVKLYKLLVSVIDSFSFSIIIVIISIAQTLQSKERQALHFPVAKMYE